MEQRIARPLGMSDTRITLTPAERARLARGHDAAGDTVSNWSLPTFAGAGALRSTLHDMLRYLEANLRADSSTALGRDMLEARMPLRATPVPATRIGLVWMVRETPGSHTVWHNGETGGYHAFIGFDPVRRLGVVMLANAGPGADDIGLHLLDPSFPMTPPPPPRAAITLTPTQLQPYVGRFAGPTGAIMDVTLKGEQLYVQLRGQPAFPIYAESDGRFFLRVVDATLTFTRDTQARVASVVLHQGGRDVPWQRVAERTAVTLSPAQLQPYVGRYAMPDGGTMSITLQGDQLYLQLTGQPAFPMFAESDGHFFLRVVEATLDFARDAQGKVTSVVLHQGGRDYPAPRMPEGG